MKPILSILFAVVIVFSCQKKVEWRVDPDTGDIVGDVAVNVSDTDALLTKMVAITSNETTTTLFLYDSMRLLVKEHLTGMASGSVVEIIKAYKRDTLGRIATIDVTKKFGVVNEVSTTTVFYDEDSKDFLRTVCTKNISGSIIIDSSVYTYDGNGHVAIIKGYRRSGTGNGTAELKEKQELAYADNNLLSIKNYRNTGTTGELVLAETKRLVYDKRINPLRINRDAFLADRIESVSQNNPISIELAGPTTTAISSMVQSRFTYGGSKKPLAAVTTTLPGGTITQVLYYY